MCGTILLLLSFMKLDIIKSAKVLELPKSDIVHTASGLVLHYVSEYQPSNKVVTFTVSLPMVADMCFLIPLSATRKIPECKGLFNKSNGIKISQNNSSNMNKTKSTNSKSMMEVPRHKRWIAPLISIAVGVASFIFGTVNTIQSLNLKSEVNSLTQSLQVSDQIMKNNRAQVLHLAEGELKLAQELNYTEYALNQTIQLVNEHSDIAVRTEEKFRTVTAITHFLNERLAALAHSVDTHFIHSSIENIMQHKLNLEFIHHKDIPKLIQLVLAATNITFDETNDMVPIIVLITKLLVQQRIDFIPARVKSKTENGILIGKLVFTSFFAATDRNQPSFSIYELVPIPFTHESRRVRLAQMPTYVGINLKTSQFLRWSREEATACSFELMTSCRETPAIRKDLEDNCIYQILTDSPLTACRVEGFSDSVFVHRVGQHWAISTNVTSKCHAVKTFDLEQHMITHNEEITLPPVALITNTDAALLVCDRFSLPGSPINVGKTVSFIQNATINPIEADLIDLYTMINNHTQWAKLPHIPSNLQAIVDFMTSTPKPEVLFGYKEWIEHPITFTGIVIAVFSIIFVGLLVYYLRLKKKKKNLANVMIQVPPYALELSTIQGALSTSVK